MADLLVLAPWLVFGAGLSAIGVRLLGQRGTSQRGTSLRGTARRRRRDTRLRHPPRPCPAMRDHGSWAAQPGRRPDGRREGR
jgi:heme exporter protein D